MSQPRIDVTRSENTEVQFGSRQESVFPYLVRLCVDFSFRVIDENRQYHLRADDALGSGAITPGFDTLDGLERYVHANMVDILHNFLFQTEEAVTH